MLVDLFQCSACRPRTECRLRGASQDWKIINWVNKQSYTENQRRTEKMIYSVHSTRTGKLEQAAEFYDYCAFSSVLSMD